MDVNFLMGRYDGELKRKDQITSAVSFPVTILTFLGSVIVTMAKGLSLQTPPVTIGYFMATATWVAFTCRSHVRVPAPSHGNRGISRGRHDQPRIRGVVPARYN
jgi:hypothetical protein